MMHEPRPAVESDDGHMAENDAIALMDKMARNVRVFRVQLLIGFFYTVLVSLDELVFLRVDEAGFEKEVPKIVQIDAIAQVGILVSSLLDQGKHFDVIIRGHIQYGNPTPEHSCAFDFFDLFAVYNLRSTTHMAAVAETDIQFRNDQSGDQYGLSPLLHYRQTRA